MVKVKEKYFKTTQSPAGILVNVNAMIHLKLKLQLKFRNNKNYSSTTVNFHTGLRQETHSLKIKIQVEQMLLHEQGRSLVRHCHVYLA